MNRLLHKYWLFIFLLGFCNLLAIDPYGLHGSGSHETNHNAAIKYTEEGNKLYEEGKYKEALDSYYRALVFNPTFALAHFGIALTNEKKGDFKEATREYTSTLIFNPGYEKASANLASLFLKKGDEMEAMKTYVKALSISPTFSLASLKEMPVSNLRKEEILALSNALKTGSLKDKKLYIYSDVDVKTALLFARYLPKLNDQGVKLLFEPPKGTTPLFKASFDTITLIDWLVLEEDIHYDLKAPLGALPFIFDAIIESKEGYLKAPQQEIDEYREWVSFKPKRIGLALPSFDNLPQGFSYYSLQTQKNDNPQVSPLTEDFDTLDEIAGAITHLDLIISSDNTLALLAASLGKPTWVILPENPEWMWQSLTSTTPWYSNVKLFHHGDNWQSFLSP